MDKIPYQIAAAERQFAVAERRLAEHKLITIPEAEAALEKTEAATIAEATEAGKIDGKNQAARDIQMQTILDDNEEVQQRREELKEAHHKMIDLTYISACQRAEWRKHRNRLDIFLATGEEQEECE